jgi:nucleoside-diphosphate-sugar epimerase
LNQVSGVRVLPVALNDTDALARVADGARIVVHAVNPAYTNDAWRTEAPAMLDQVMALCTRLNARLMLPGNVYNFGVDMPQALTELTPQRAGTVKGAARTAMEHALAQASKNGRLQVVVIRAGDFFGSGSGTWFDQTITPKLTRWRMGYFGTLDIPTAWAYLPDLAQTFVQVAAVHCQQPERLAAFEVLHFAGHCLSGEQWRDALTDVAWEQGWLREGGRLSVSALPWGIIRIGAVFNATWAALLEMRYLWTRPHHLVNAKLVRLIGREPHTPLPVAVRASLTDLGLMGLPVRAPVSLPQPTPTAERASA